MTCKDCIHFCVCDRYTAPNESYPEVGGCKLFKSASEVAKCDTLITEFADRLGRRCVVDYRRGITYCLASDIDDVKNQLLESGKGESV